MAEDFVIVIPAYDGVDLLDVAAPSEMFSWVSSIPSTGQNVQVIVAGEKPVIATRGPGAGGLKIVPQDGLSNIKKADLLWVPGGDPSALKIQMANPKYMGFLRDIAADATYVTSVCEGALLLAEAGLLNGFEATTHWAFINCLKKYPGVKVVPGYPRFWVDDHAGPKGIRVTGGGISSGLDEALELIRRFAGQAAAEGAQLTTQYINPDPPVHAKLPSQPPTCPMGNP